MKPELTSTQLEKLANVLWARIMGEDCDLSELNERANLVRKQRSSRTTRPFEAEKVPAPDEFEHLN